MVWRNGRILNPKEILVNDTAHEEISEEALSINKIDLETHVQLALPIEDARREFYDYVVTNFGNNRRTTLGGHNVQFDISFLKEFLGEGKLDRYFSYRALDTSSILKFIFHCGLVNTDLGGLSNALKFFGFSQEELDGAHNALNDAKNTAKLYNRLLGKVIDVRRS